MRRVLVTGATGFLGRNVMGRLKAVGVPALGLGRDGPRLAALADAGFVGFAYDLAEPLDVAVHDQLGDVDAIVHCAALSAPFGALGDFERANVTATRNLVAFARRQGVQRFVHISSPSVYFAFRDQIDVREDAPLPRPVNYYAKTKRQAEAIVLAAPEAGPVILRPRGLYGAGDRSLLPRLLEVAAKRPLPLLRNGQARIDLTHIDDAADAILAALFAGRDAEGQIFNVSGGEVLPVRHIVDEACARVGIAARWRALPLWPAMLAAGVTEAAAHRWPGRPEPAVTRYGLGLFAYAQSLDLAKAARILGWAPRIAFEEGLRRTFPLAAAT